ncbi:helicase-related protein [Vibrio vulnificus]|uniref:helicase-related protein n=1 Tax=Vibrio vulnificus TaxID=672 RepID=UPI0029B7CA5A|nr:ATP-dependent RNA helicase [Vibrio vulnificus]
MSALPIDAIKAQFDHHLGQTHLVVEAETGSGKSTRLPLWAAEHGRVLVIEPRRIACTSLAEFLAEQSGQPLGSNVGYAIKLQAAYDAQTNIVFVTPGVALRWLAEDGLSAFDIVIIDEFHERRWDMDLLTAMLKAQNKHRLVLTSATLAGEKLAKYLNAERLQSQGRCYPVSIEYRAKESHLLPSKKQCEHDVMAAINEVLQTEGQDILVFLPGRKEISNIASQLQAQPSLVVAKLHASISDEEKRIALSVQTQRKVVLATNVAETSLTIPNITTVIDSGLERRTIQRNGRTTLILSHISKASAAQRAGRAGRVMAGQCLRLYGEHAPLELATPPELQREELSEPMLAAACCGYRLAELEFLDGLPEKSLVQAHKILNGMQAITAEGKVTEHGQKLYPLPVDTLYADLVTRMPTKALKEAMIDLAAGLSVPAALYQIKGGEEAEKLLEQEPQQCDATLMIQLIRGQRFSGVIVDDGALDEARGLSQQMRDLFELPDLEVSSRYTRVELVTAIARLHPELVFIRRAKRREALGNGKMEMMVGRQSRFSDKHELALVLDSHSLPGKGVKQTLNLASVIMPAPLTLINELELGEWRQGETRPSNDAVEVEMQLVYAGRVVESRLEQPQGEDAIETIVVLVKTGQLLPDLYAFVTTQMTHWHLYCALGLNEEQRPIGSLDFDQWLREQLHAMGVNEVDEMALFESCDFPYRGIPDWQYKDFAEQFPLSLSLPDLQLTVEYFPAGKLVQVVFAGGNRKGDPKRWELPRFSGWRVQYRKASRVIDVR